MTPTPIALGLLLCDRVITDRDSGCPSLIGVFTRMEMDGFPSSPQEFSAFAILSGGNGAGTIELEVIRLDNGDLIYGGRQPLDFLNRQEVVYANVKLRGIRFPAATIYGVDFLVDGVPIAQRRFEVTATGGQLP